MTTKVTGQNQAKSGKANAKSIALGDPIARAVGKVAEIERTIVIVTTLQMAIKAGAKSGERGKVSVNPERALRGGVIAAEVIILVWRIIAIQVQI